MTTFQIVKLTADQKERRRRIQGRLRQSPDELERLLIASHAQPDEECSVEELVSELTDEDVQQTGALSSTL